MAEAKKYSYCVKKYQLLQKYEVLKVNESLLEIEKNKNLENGVRLKVLSNLKPTEQKVQTYLPMEEIKEETLNDYEELSEHEDYGFQPKQVLVEAKVKEDLSKLLHFNP
jgi:hypothetical protein